MSLFKTLPTSTVTSLPCSASEPPPPPLFNLEFRNLDDDAWYSVRTVLDGQKLIVKYQNFTDDDDLVLSPNSFRSCEDLVSLRLRFRSLSAQVQDSECYSLDPNAVLCTSHSFPSLAVLFYDAVLEQVISKKHCFENGEERCLCKFMVVWKHGPLAGCLAVKGVEDICFVNPIPWNDDNVTSFIHIVTEKLGIPAVDKTILLPSKGSDSPSPSGNKAAFAQRFRLQRTECARTSLPGYLVEVEDAGRPAGCIEKSREDNDIGGGSNHFVMLIENLQKDLSPSVIEEFIHRQTSINVKAYVHPSLAFETYTKAFIVFCQQDMEKLLQLLDSPNHIIMSKRGSRPWVVSAVLSECNAFMGPIQTLIIKYQHKLLHRGVRMDEEQLRLVPSESEEYAAAKELRDLFVEFMEHQRGLHRRLGMEEEKVLLASHVAT